MSNATRATRFLGQAGIGYRLHAYDYQREAGAIVLHAAATLGGKSADMMPPADAERATGYKVGGISPFGQQRRGPVLIETSAMNRAMAASRRNRARLQACIPMSSAS